MSDVYTEFKTGTYDPQMLQQRGFDMVRYGPGDSSLIVGFYKRSVLNVAKSKDAGKPVHENRDYVKISHPGESLNELDRPVQEQDKSRWPRQWAQFCDNQRQIPDGIPLSLLFPAQPNIADTLRGYNIHVVEQLSNLSGHAISTIGMGAQDWVNAAKKYLEQANKGVDYHRFTSELQHKDNEIATLKAQLNDLSAKVSTIVSRQEAPPNIQTHDFQQEVLDNVAAEQRSPQFNQPDLSADTAITRKPRADKGKTRGPRNRSE